MKNKFILILSLIFIVSSCSGLTGKRSDKSDEFLIDKKNPLVMPPEINDLPKPSESEYVERDDNNFEKILKSEGSDSEISITNNSSNLQESILKKIEQ